MQKRTLDLVQQLLDALAKSRLPYSHRSAALRAALDLNEGLKTYIDPFSDQETYDPSFDPEKSQANSLPV